MCAYLTTYNTGKSKKTALKEAAEEQIKSENGSENGAVPSKGHEDSNLIKAINGVENASDVPNALSALEVT